jgi:predicted MFS family arabinose efflux permease
MQQALKHYLTITGGYWAFTITDGAIRMLVVLYFHLLGYSPFQVAMLFLFYEFFGIVTNLLGGWLGARIGLNKTMHIGMALQIGALAMLTVPDGMLSVAYVMFAQAISGIAKDLNKMSAKASVKTIAGEGKLFQWVAALTGSKNALKGAGFFIGAGLLEWVGFRTTLWVLAGTLTVVFIVTLLLLPNNVGKSKAKPKFTQIFSNKPAINWLSATRFFLFGSRDVWFVVGLPVFLYETLQWSFSEVGAFMALWVIGYGFIQAFAPKLMRGTQHGGKTTRLLAFLLALIPAGIALGLTQGYPANYVLILGLALFAFVFAVNSAVHSYLVLAYADHDKVAMNVGFYYMANAGGRLTGTVLSGLVYQIAGLAACLWLSMVFLLLASVISCKLPDTGQN